LSVLVTRPAEDARRTIGKITARGMEALAAPVLEIVPLDTFEIPENPAAILLTSANAVSAVADREGTAELLPLPVFTVGERTAEAARQAGFTDVRSAGGDVGDLIALVRRMLEPEERPVVYFSGRDISFDLDGALRQAGYDAKRIVVYEARAADAFSAEVRQALQDGEVEAVLFYSPRSARTFAALAENAGLSDRLADIRALALSERVGALAKTFGFRDVLIAATPEEPALLAALEELFKGHRQD
jgi:uroporphyrinogen-III synthase